MRSRTLATLKSGEKGVIHSIQGDKLIKQRLSSMGFSKGIEVQVDKSSLMGDPRSYTVRGYTICMRKAEAENIIID